jgi:hypothetical protein
MNTSRAQKDLIFLIRGQDEGQPVWYYFQVKSKIKMELLYKHSQTKNENIPLEEYGTILESGYGDNPPNEIKTKMDCLYS